VPDGCSSSAQSLRPQAAVFILWVFALSRIVVIAAIAVSPWVIPPVIHQPWNLEDPLLRPLFRWDTGWYLTIAQHGYMYNGNPQQEQNIVFLPLYPLTCRLCHLGTGLSIPWCAVLLSHLAFLLALVLLYMLITRELGSAVARRAVLLLAFFPASLFFSTMYTEAFYLAFSLLAFSAFRQRRWLRGGLWAGLASGTRVSGILLVLPLLCEALPRLTERRRWWRVLLASGLAGSGLVAFMGYQWLAFGDPFANFRVAGEAWGRRWGWPVKSLVRGLLKTGAASWSPAPVNAWMGILFLALVGVLPRYLPISYAMYTGASMAMAMCTKAGIESLTRYLVVLFPGFMALGLIGQHSRALFWVLLGVFILTLVVFAMRYTAWYWVV
jgi:Mannosyltransferase (PIG-V)